MKALLSIATVLLLAQTARAEDWPGWRGPRGDGTSLDKNAPLRWSAQDNIVWKSEIPGSGHSSPVVVGDKVFLTTCLLKEKQRVLLALDRSSGKILWQRVVVTAPLEKKHRLNSFASSTPASDGKHVWISFLQYPDMVVACYDMDGNLAWKKSPGKFYSVHGFCSSPVLFNDLVIVNGDQDAQAYIVALDKNTGEERWRADRPNRTRSYCVPVIVDMAGKKQLVLSGSLCVASYDPQTGKQHWIIDGPTEQFVASLVPNQGLLFLTTGFPEYHNLAIRPDGVGNVTKTHIAWHEKNVPARKASYVPSPIAFDKYFYVISDLGWLSAFEATTGKRLWLEKLGRHHSGSPVLANGHLYMTDDDGITHVLKAGAKFEVVARNELGDDCYSSPAVSGGRLYIRTTHALWCIGK
ncbi:MAG: serine/threonine protein kinase [Planctomycetes bacterium]|nr:serine/threonine protein kinase [Planctomycetota bacterium]